MLATPIPVYRLHLNTVQTARGHVVVVTAQPTALHHGARRHRRALHARTARHDGYAYAAVVIVGVTGGASCAAQRRYARGQAIDVHGRVVWLRRIRRHCGRRVVQIARAALQRAALLLHGGRLRRVRLRMLLLVLLVQMVRVVMAAMVVVLVWWHRRRMLAGSQCVGMMMMMRHVVAAFVH